MRRHEPHAGFDHAIPSLAGVIPLTEPLLALAQQAQRLVARRFSGWLPIAQGRKSFFSASAFDETSFSERSAG